MFFLKHLLLVGVHLLPRPANVKLVRLVKRQDLHFVDAGLDADVRQVVQGQDDGQRSPDEHLNVQISRLEFFTFQQFEAVDQGLVVHLVGQHVVDSAQPRTEPLSQRVVSFQFKFLADVTLAGPRCVGKFRGKLEALAEPRIGFEGQKVSQRLRQRGTRVKVKKRF